MEVVGRSGRTYLSPCLGAFLSFFGCLRHWKIRWNHLSTKYLALSAWLILNNVAALLYESHRKVARVLDLLCYLGQVATVLELIILVYSAWTPTELADSLELRSSSRHPSR